MKIRYKAPSGGGMLDVDDTITVGQLLSQIKGATALSDITVKFGWPPKALTPEQTDVTAQSLGLQRESLTVANNAPVPDVAPPPPSATAPQSSQESSRPQDVKDQNISVQMPGGSSLVLRVMPDDNSCLFTAVGGALRGHPSPNDAYSSDDLRRIVVQRIADDPIKFNEAILESSPQNYCARMLRPDTWGGAIELGIFSEHFALEICVVDVKTGTIIRYGEENHYDSRCILVYSNIHYDRVAETFVEGQVDTDFDVTRWPVEGSDQYLVSAQQLCKDLKEKHHYYTDTSDFVVMCNLCGWVGQGQRSVADHAKQTGHTDITEIEDK